MNLLLVEDDISQQKLFSHFLKRAQGVDNVVVEVAKNCEEAISFLEGSPRPALIITDLFIPTDSCELIRAIRNIQHLKTIPILVFSSSVNPDDIERSYQTGANAYIAKPFSLDDYEMIIGSILTFWFRIVMLPNILSCTSNPKPDHVFAIAPTTLKHCRIRINMDLY